MAPGGDGGVRAVAVERGALMWLVVVIAAALVVPVAINLLRAITVDAPTIAKLRARLAAEPALLDPPLAIGAWRFDRRALTLAFLDAGALVEASVLVDGGALPPSVLLDGPDRKWQRYVVGCRCEACGVNLTPGELARVPGGVRCPRGHTVST